MPELPEVEVVKRSLSKIITNLTLKKVKINNGKLRYKINKNSFNRIKNLKLISISRRSKYLLFNFEKNYTMIAHLGMTGKFFLIDKNNQRRKTSFYYEITNKDKKHNHIIFYFNEGVKLIYNDVRRFGFIKTYLTKKINNSFHICNLGPEPLSKKLNKKYFQEYLNGKKKILKDVLMDQKFIAGLGNIYVNEILNYSKISPRKNVKNLSSKIIDKLISNIKKILKKSIQLGGSSIKDFSNIGGKIGKFQQVFHVYGRNGKNCLNKNCYGTIIKIVISNRATFYCNICQK